MNLDSIMLSEFEARHKGLSSASLYLHEMSRTGKFTDKKADLCLPGAGRKKDRAVTVNGYRFSFWGDENVM